MTVIHCDGEQEKLTFKNVSNDPFSMYSVIIITGLPIEMEGEAGEKETERNRGK